MPKQFIQYVNFLLFSADQIMQELLEDSIFGKSLYNLDCRGISQNMIQNRYGFRYFCIGNYLRNVTKNPHNYNLIIQSMKGYPFNVCCNRHQFINGVMFPGNLCNSF